MLFLACPVFFAATLCIRFKSQVRLNLRSHFIFFVCMCLVFFSRRWITVRDRTRTTCPFLASTAPQRVGEEAHENGIGMPPPPPAAGAKACNVKKNSTKCILNRSIDRSIDKPGFLFSAFLLSALFLVVLVLLFYISCFIFPFSCSKFQLYIVHFSVFLFQAQFAFFTVSIFSVFTCFLAQRPFRGLTPDRDRTGEGSDRLGIRASTATNFQFPHKLFSWPGSVFGRA